MQQQTGEPLATASAQAGTHEPLHAASSAAPARAEAAPEAHAELQVLTLMRTVFHYYVSSLVIIKCKEHVISL